MQIRSVLSTVLALSLMTAAAANAATMTLSMCQDESDPCGLSRPELAVFEGEIRLEPGAATDLGSWRGVDLSTSRGMLRVLDYPRGRIEIRDHHEAPTHLVVASWWQESGRWSFDDAQRFVADWQGRYPQFNFDEFRRHWHHERDRHDHGDSDDNIPKPVPLPGAALLFGPALLMLRAFQRRNA